MRKCKQHSQPFLVWEYLEGNERLHVSALGDPEMLRRWAWLDRRLAFEFKQFIVTHAGPAARDHAAGDVLSNGDHLHIVEVRALTRAFGEYETDAAVFEALGITRNHYLSLGLVDFMDGLRACRKRDHSGRHSEIVNGFHVPIVQWEFFE